MDFYFFCIMCLIVYYYNQSTPVVQENPWINNDSSRPVTDIKELDYNRRLIIYRAEEPRRQLREFECPRMSEYMAPLKTYTKITTTRYMNIFTIKEY